MKIIGEGLILLFSLKLTKLKYIRQIFKIDFLENEMKECCTKPFSHFFT